MTKFSFIPESGVKIVGASSLVLRANIKNAGKAWEDLEIITDTMYDRQLFPQNKFVRIGLLFLYGIKTELKPRYERIDRTYKDLPITVELDTNILRWADKNSFELMKEIFLIATCEAVLDVLRKYKLPTESVENIRKQYGKIPDSEEECIEWVERHKT
ncbi:MAG TPA: Imm39 family immunity protein [Alphaproteobacteria bacterium]|nr:Imm39 family immunity protein [Alphaproteobacteria bacterium]